MKIETAMTWLRHTVNLCCLQTTNGHENYQNKGEGNTRE